MPTLHLVAIICEPCRKGWHIKPEEAYEPGALEYPRLRDLKCPDCEGRLKRMPEYGEPTMMGPIGYWPVSPEVAWMS